MSPLFFFAKGERGWGDGKPGVTPQSSFCFFNSPFFFSSLRREPHSIDTISVQPTYDYVQSPMT